MTSPPQQQQNWRVFTRGEGVAALPVLPVCPPRWSRFTMSLTLSSFYVVRQGGGAGDYRHARAYERARRESRRLGEHGGGHVGGSQGRGDDGGRHAAQQRPGDGHGAGREEQAQAGREEGGRGERAGRRVGRCVSERTGLLRTGYISPTNHLAHSPSRPLTDSPSQGSCRKTRARRARSVR